VQLPHTYQTGQQRIIGWIVAAVVLGTAVFTIAGPGGVDGYVTGLVGFLIATASARFAMCRVTANDDGVQVVNTWRTLLLRWEEIDRFEVVPFGACPIRLRNGRTVLMTGIQQKNISGMRGTHDTPERRMIDELNALLHQRSPPTATTSPAPT
jgi:hypothetical protein